LREGLCYINLYNIYHVASLIVGDDHRMLMMCHHIF